MKRDPNLENYPYGPLKGTLLSQHSLPVNLSRAAWPVDSTQLYALLQGPV